MNYPEWPLISTDSHIALKMPESEIKARVPAKVLDEILPMGLEAEDMLKTDGASVPGGATRRHKPRTADQIEKVPSETMSAEERLPFMAVDGVGAEVLFGSIQLGRGKTLEADIIRHQVNNDWLHEVFQKQYDRFAPGASLPIDRDIPAAIEEMKRVAKLGIRPCVIPMHLDHKQYNRPDYDRFWEAAQDLDMPIAIHVATGRDPRFHGNPGGAIPNYVYVASNTTETMSLLVCAGIMERHPQLKILFSETEAGWLGWLMECMDRQYLKHQHWVSVKLPMMPSEYVKRQMLISLMEDPAALSLTPITGTDCLSWGNDFPHNEGTWPYSRDVVAETFKDLTLEETKKITHDNATKMLRFKAEKFIEPRKN